MSRQHGTQMLRRARAERFGDLDSRTGLAALRKRDGVRPALVREALPCSAFGGIERRARRALARLRPELRIPDADAADELHELERQLVRDETMMGKRRRRGLGVIHAPHGAGRVTAPRCFPALHDGAGARRAPLGRNQPESGDPSPTPHPIPQATPMRRPHLPFPFPRRAGAAAPSFRVAARYLTTRTLSRRARFRGAPPNPSRNRSFLESVLRSRLPPSRAPIPLCERPIRSPSGPEHQSGAGCCPARPRRTRSCPPLGHALTVRVISTTPLAGAAAEPMTMDGGRGGR